MVNSNRSWPPLCQCAILQCRPRKQENSGAHWDRLTAGFRPVWQMKDQSKKVANLKHKEQVEKSKNAQLMEEARKREDNINESSQQVKTSGQQCHCGPAFVVVFGVFPGRCTLMRLHRGPLLEAATAASFSQDHQPPPSPTGTSRSGFEALRL
ncbi:ELKS/Rab6-interacting/CAST family member 1 [Anabarilius grahami]|uniref:ELKS/Rab6-interacting/CAST family member 1 n=1 Tax=Anabarilius grahami TaxID=495550 RepID=A0A3N0Z279_ANAGA|nr:ELKS/Rab6-interacting/CAST family member 1 [Anabarilius grahami]